MHISVFLQFNSLISPEVIVSLVKRDSLEGNLSVDKLLIKGEEKIIFQCFFNDVKHALIYWRVLT